MAGALEDELGGLSGGALVDLQGAQGVFAHQIAGEGVATQAAWPAKGVGGKWSHRQIVPKLGAARRVIWRELCASLTVGSIPDSHH